jgi:PD-(D/E)XK nuclease superfamily
MIMCGMNAETLKGAEKIENTFSALIKDSAIEVHRVLGGPGLLESVYEEALFRELQSHGGFLQ